MHGAFRSHLMQQFAAAARQQSRGPPMALAGWLREQQDESSSDEENAAIRATIPIRNVPSDAGFTISSGSIGISDVSSSSPSGRTNRLQRTLSSKGRKSIPRSTPSTPEGAYNTTNQEDHDIEYWNLHHPLPIPPSLSPHRNETSGWMSSSSHAPLMPLEEEVYAVAFDRAIAAAANDIPNLQKQVSFRRFFRGSEPLQQLCCSTKAAVAGIATLVHQDQSQISVNSTTHNCEDGDDELPFVPPSSWSDLEAYGTACAASHSVLLSLRSQGLHATTSSSTRIASQRARQLLQASPYQRVVALVIVTETAAPVERFD